MGKKSFALSWNDRIVLKLDKAHQELLFEIRPETFQKCKVATVFWSYVALEHLEVDELADLVYEAWACIVPKKISRAVLATRGSVT